MYKCNNCNHTFETPRTKTTTYELIYGVSSDFSGSTRVTLDLCPICDSENIKEIVEEKEN